MPFEILQVDSTSVVGDEQLGSKTKFWFMRGDERWLFKEARPGTGEDWAEKIASEIARLTGVQAATVELARFEGRAGSASRSFRERSEEGLVHGNEILAGQIVGYERDKRLHQSDHTLQNIGAAIRNLVTSTEICDDVLRRLAEYFVLDALIGNTDRHHENWGLLVRIERVADNEYVDHLKVAPSFDHASSLGRELRDEERQAILARGGIGGYVRKARGGIYLQSTDKKGASPLALVDFGLTQWPEQFGAALSLVTTAPIAGLHAIVEQLPEPSMTGTARAFAKALLSETHQQLRGRLS